MNLVHLDWFSCWVATISGKFHLIDSMMLTHHINFFLILLFKSNQVSFLFDCWCYSIPKVKARRKVSRSNEGWKHSCLCSGTWTFLRWLGVYGSAPFKIDSKCRVSSIGTIPRFLLSKNTQTFRICNLWLQFVCINRIKYHFDHDFNR